MLTEFGGDESAFDYSAEEFEGWAKEVGFSRCESVLHLGGPASAVVAIK